MSDRRGRCQVPPGLDAIYVTASRRDARFTRICVASIRHFYPDAPILLLKGGRLQPGLEDELRRFWNVGRAVIADRDDWGYGFVKLEPLFMAPGHRFMVLDSDIVLGGAVLGHWSAASPQFVVDDETQDEAATHGTYYDWREVQAIDPAARPPAFVFNSGQWFGTSGVLTRADFAPWLDWSGPVPMLRHPGLFRSGEQGLLNYVMNRKVAAGEVTIERCDIMHWPGTGMDDFTLTSVLDRSASPRVVHWAGLKRRRIDRMTGGDILTHFERFYYSRIAFSGLRRCQALFDHNVGELSKALRHRIAHGLG